MRRKVLFSVICLFVAITLSYIVISTMCTESKHADIVSNNISNSLLSCLSHYILKTDPFFLDVTCQCYKGCIFYNVYFFEKNNESFFMFLTWPYIVNRYVFTKESQIYLEYFNDRKVVFFINAHETNESSLYKKNFIALKRAWSELKLNKPCPIYSGSKYPETYKYKTDNDTVLIEKADSLFYESFVGADFARFENLFRSLPNGYRENKCYDN